MSTKSRYALLDELRGFAVICMVVFHGIYLYNIMFDDQISAMLFQFFNHAEPYFASFFIFLSGLCSVLSHSNIRRGLKLAAVAVLISVVTLAAGEFGLDIAIYFGVIHLLALSILFCGLTYKALFKIPSLLGLALCLLAFFITYPVLDGNIWLFVTRYSLPEAWYSTNYLFWLGFPNRYFTSADYFPVLPWLFMFLSGFFAGAFFRKHGFPSLFKARLVPFFGTVGRNALLIYILHQPVLYSVFLMINKIL